LLLQIQTYAESDERRIEKITVPMRKEEANKEIFISCQKYLHTVSSHHNYFHNAISSSVIGLE